MAFAAMSSTPDLLRQIRSDVFQSLAESWENFMRSPQFLDTMKQMMEQTIAMRKAANEFVGKARHEMQAPSREDLDAVMLFVRHMEKRLLDRLDDLSTQVDRLSRQAPAKPSARAKGAPPDSVKTGQEQRESGKVMTEQTTTDNPCLMWQKAMVEEMTRGRADGPSAVSPPAGAARQKGLTPPKWCTRRTASSCAIIRAKARFARAPRWSSFTPWSTGLISLILKRGRSVVANFVEHGFDTYLVDWGVPGDADRH